MFGSRKPVAGYEFKTEDGVTYVITNPKCTSSCGRSRMSCRLHAIIGKKLIQSIKISRNFDLFSSPDYNKIHTSQEFKAHLFKQALGEGKWVPNKGQLNGIYYDACKTVEWGIAQTWFEEQKDKKKEGTSDWPGAKWSGGGWVNKDTSPYLFVLDVLAATIIIAVLLLILYSFIFIYHPVVELFFLAMGVLFYLGVKVGAI